MTVSTSIKPAGEKKGGGWQGKRSNCPRRESVRLREKVRFEAIDKTIGSAPYSENVKDRKNRKEIKEIYF